MISLGRILVFALLLTFGAASAQEGKGWFGADLLDVTKAEADKLNWDNPRGAKVGVVAPGSPAEKAGLKTGDMILAIDRTMLETSSDAESAVAARRPGDELRLLILSGGSERRVSVALAEQRKITTARNQGGPLLMLDTGGHMALIMSLDFTPDGKHLVSAGADKVIRVWDWQAAKTIRTMRGQVGSGDEGKIYAMALSPDGRWLAAGGWNRVPGQLGQVIRLHDFATGKPVALLKGLTGTVQSLAFSPYSTRLISGSGLGDLSAVIWDVESHQPLHRLLGHTAEINGVAFTPDGQRVVTGSYDTTLRLWRVADGSLIAELKGHKSKDFGLRSIRLTAA